MIVRRLHYFIVLTFLVCLINNIFCYKNFKTEIFDFPIDEKNKQKILEEHNKFRALHGVPNLVLDKNISFYAQQWTRYSILRGVLVPRSDNKYGENLWKHDNANYKNFMKVNSLNPVRYWYDQIKYFRGYYDPNAEKNTSGFTQIVWKSSKKLGVGISVHGRKIFVACYYDPPGNTLSNEKAYSTYFLYRKNVFPPAGVEWENTYKLLYLVIVAVVLIFSGFMWFLSRMNCDIHLKF